MESETKKCPYCGEEIMAVAKKCKYCGEWLEEKNVPTQQHVDYPEEAVQKVQIEPEEEEEKLPGFFEYYLEQACGWTEGFSSIFNFDFSDTIPRRQFWGAVIILNFIGLVCTLLLSFTTRWVCVIIVIALCIKLLELQIRRLHDIDKSGWLVLLNLIPVVNLYLLVLYFTKGSDSLQTKWNSKDTINLLCMIGALIIALLVASAASDSYSYY